MMWQRAVRGFQVGNVTDVTLWCQPAQATMRTSRQKSHTVRFELVTGVRVTRAELIPVPLRDYGDLRVEPLRHQERTFRFPAAMAGKLVEFVKTCFVHGAEGYDHFSFMYYMVGAAISPLSKERFNLRGALANSASISLGAAYMLEDANRRPVRPFIGLKPNVALIVGGQNGGLMVSGVDQLMIGFGATRITQLFRVG